MGVLTDFVIADRTAAQLVGETSVPSQAFNGIDAKGMDQVRMTALYAILSGTAFDPEFLASDDSFAYIGSEEGPWVQTIPADMVEKLASLSPFQIPAIAKQWSESEEFEPEWSGWSLEAVVWFLREIGKLSRTAISEDKALFMWTSL